LRHFSSAKFGLRAVAQAMAPRNSGPKNIPRRGILLIDAGRGTAKGHPSAHEGRRKGSRPVDIPPDSLTKTLFHRRSLLVRASANQGTGLGPMNSISAPSVGESGNMGAAPDLHAVGSLETSRTIRPHWGHARTRVCPYKNEADWGRETGEDQGQPNIPSSIPVKKGPLLLQDGDFLHRRKCGDRCLPFADVLHGRSAH